MAAGDRGRPGAVYNIGGGSRVSINQVLDLIGRHHRPDAWISGAKPAQKGDMRDTFADTTRARDRPRVSALAIRSSAGWPPSASGWPASLSRSRR